MAGRVTQLAIEVLRAGGPRALVTQAAIEVLRTGSPRSRLTQESVEVLRSSADQAAAGGGAVMIGGGLGIGLMIGIPQPLQTPGVGSMTMGEGDAASPPAGEGSSEEGAEVPDGSVPGP